MARLNAIDEARSLYEKLRGGVSQVAGRVGSFVQKNPLPVAYANQQFQQRVAQPVVKKVQSFTNYQAPLEQQTQNFVTRAGSYLGPQGTQAIQNAFPITQVPYNVGEQVRSVGRIASGKPNPYDLLQVGLSVAGVVRPSASVGFNKKALTTIRNGYNPEVRNVIGKFAQEVEMNPSGVNRKSLGALGDQVQTIAEATFGKKVANLTNRQLKNLFDTAMEAADRKTAPKGFSVGLQAKPLRSVQEAERLKNIKSSSKFVPSKTEKKLGIEGRARGVALSGKTPTIEPQVSTASMPGKSTIPTPQGTLPQPQSPEGKSAIDSTTGSLQKTPQTSGASISQETNSYLSELSKRQNDARKAGTKVGTIKRLYNDLKTKFIDSTAPIEDVLTEAEKKGKFTVLPKNDVRLQIDRVLRSPSIAGQFAKDNGLTQVIKDAPDLNALDQYMIAKHAKTIEATGRKTGRDLTKDQQLVNELGATYEPLAQRVTAYSRKLLDYSVDTGLISKDLADKLKSAYPDYVPLNRIMEEVERTGPVGRRGVASLSSQSVVKKLVGSEREIDSPIATLVAKTEDAFAQGERNVAARQLASYKDLPGFKGLITELSGNTTGKHTFSFIDNGVKRTFETTPEIAAAAKSLNREQLGFIGNILSVPTRILRLGATGVNVPFVAANIIKDQLTGFVNSSTVAKTSLLNPANFLRALWSAGKHDELYDDLVRAGAGGTSFDIGRMQPKLAVEKIRSGRNIASKIGYTVRHPGELITALEDLIGKSEELGRLQQFRGTKQALTGRTAQDQTLLAAKAARENTANFARAGDWGRVLNVIIPYFNAGIQGARATVTALQKRPAQTSAKIAIGLFTPVAAATMWNLSDPARKKVYEDIDDFEKENNIILVLDPNKGSDKGRYSGVIKIPIQQGFGGLSTGVRRGIEQAYGLDPVKMGEVASGLIQFGTSLNVGSGREFLSSITPQALKVPIETTTNTNLFTGKQIVPQYMKSKPADEQVYDFTSGTARLIGKGLNTSPLVVQNAVNTSMGGVGRQLLNASDTALNKLGVIPNSQVGGESVGDATAKRFFSASGGKQLDEAYALKDKRDNAKRQAVQAFVSGDSESALKIMKENKIQLDKSDIKTFKTNQTKKAADLFIENKQDGALEIMKKYKLQLSQSDVNKAAKRKAVELYKLGLKDEALVIMKKYKIQLTKKDIE